MPPIEPGKTLSTPRNGDLLMICCHLPSRWREQCYSWGASQEEAEAERDED